MAKDNEEVVEEKEKVVKEDEAHKAFRAIIEAYKVKNPEKYELKKAAFEVKLKQKLALGLKPDGTPDGSVVVVK